jgi:hypothetical protein
MFSVRALLASGKPHPVSELHARTFSVRALLAFGKPHPVSELRSRRTMLVGFGCFWGW